MAVLSRTLIASSERLDLPDLKSIEAFMAGDMKYLLKGFTGNTAYILNGFDIINPTIGSASCSVRIADSAVFFPNSSAGAFFYGLPAGNPLSQPLQPSLKQSATNYIYAVFTTSDGVPDTRSFWDPDLNGGAGGENAQNVNTATMLRITLNVSVSTFPTDTIPIAKIVTDSAGIIQSIEDCRNLMFRLGTGGLNPDPNARFNFRSSPSVGYERQEPPVTMIGGGINPFEGGDKNIYTLKEWMDAIMTKIAELTGTPFWYQHGPSISVASTFNDSLGSTFKSKGVWQHDSSIAGKITWTEDIIYKSLVDLRDVIIRADTVTLANEQVAFINMTRDADINGGPVPVTFYNSLSYINGPVGSFQNLSKGDWIKKKLDTNDKYCQVEEFYLGIGGSGGVATAANALSVVLTSPYNGASETTYGSYSKGVYGNSDVQIAYRNSPAIQAAAGNYMWLAARSDTIMAISNASTFTLNGNVISNDGTTATINVTTHGLRVGDRITTTIPIAGTFLVTEIIDSDNFALAVNATGLGAFTAYYAIITTTTTVVDGIQKESANHGFESNETIYVAGTTNYNGGYLINVVSPTSFQIPIPSAVASEFAGTATGVRVEVKRPFGAIRIVQGETIQIGEIDGSNIQSFIGMKTLAETHPTYLLHPSYNTIHGMENFNTDPTDNLTDRAAKITAMMADRIQDRSLTIRGAATFKNTTNGANQDITANSTLIFDKPKSPSQVVTLDCSIPVSSAAVTTIDRNSNAAISITIENLSSSLLLAENKFILFYRFSDNNVYDWQGHLIPPGGLLTYGTEENAQSKNISFMYLGQVTLDTTLNKLVFSDTSANGTIVINSSANNNTIDVAAVMTSGITLLDGQSVWVKVDRTAAKVINAVSYADVEDTVASGMLYVTNRDAVPVAQDVLVLFERVGNTLLGEKRREVFEGNIYEERLEVLIDIAANSIVNIPNDSRDSGNPQYYVVGAGQLEVWHGGIRLSVGASNDWEEVPGSIIVTLSNQIRILRDIKAGEALTFRMDNNSGVYFANNMTIGQNLQQTYDTGRFIVVNSGQPIDITGPSGEKLMAIHGDMQVDGIVDPSAVTLTEQTSNPVTADKNALFADTVGNLIYQKANTGTVDLVNDYVRRDGTLALTGNIDADNHTIINLPDPSSAGDAASKNYTDDQDSATLSAANSYSSGLVGTLGGSLPTTYLKLDGTNAMAADINANSHTIKNLIAPTTSDRAATKGYVDDKARYSAVYKLASNAGGGTLLAGSIVRITGVNAVNLANAASLSLSEGVIGVVSGDILVGQTGYVQIAGEATVLLESGGLSVSNRAYVSTAVAGTATSAIPTASGQVVFSLGVASDTNKVVLNPNLDAINENVYDELATMSIDTPPGTPVTLPNDSRNGNAAQYYVVGEALLEVYFNGVKLNAGAGNDYQEIGAPGSSSNSILINRQLYAGEKLRFVINIKNSAYFFSASVGAATLQSAYNAGSTITVATGTPVYIAGVSGKLLHVAGDVQVDGVLDPTGITLTPQSSSPIPVGQVGIWADLSGAVNHQSAAGASTSLGSSSTLVGTNASPGLMIAGTPVGIDTNGDFVMIDVTSEDSAFSFVGITAHDIPSGESGVVLTAGTFYGLNNSFNYRKVLYVDKTTGYLTAIKPAIGVNGGAANDFVIKVGVVVKNPNSMASNALVICSQIIGTL